VKGDLHVGGLMVRLVHQLGQSFRTFNIRSIGIRNKTHAGDFTLPYLPA